MPFQYWYQNKGAQLDKYIADSKDQSEYIEEQKQQMVHLQYIEHGHS